MLDVQVWCGRTPVANLGFAGESAGRSSFSKPGVAGSSPAGIAKNDNEIRNLLDRGLKDRKHGGRQGTQQGTQITRCLSRRSPSRPRPPRTISARVPKSLLVHGHGVSMEMLVDLIKAGLARVRVERVSRPAMEVTHVEITDAGRKAVE